MLFYTSRIENGLAFLDEEESRHLLTVLRRQPGDRLQLTDGQGFFYTAELAETSKKSAVARILDKTVAPPDRPARLHVGIAPTKQIERLEWFLEKATEIGIDEITPLLCRRSERDTIRTDRLEKILVSAMKQSLRAQLPKLNPLTPLKKVLEQAVEPQKRLAWCGEEPMPHLKTTLEKDRDVLILIGPEGDFAPEEVALAFQNGFVGVSLGAARLRTETAGLLAVCSANLLVGA